MGDQWVLNSLFSVETDLSTLVTKKCFKVKRSTVVGFDPSLQQQKFCIYHTTDRQRDLIFFYPIDLKTEFRKNGAKTLALKKCRATCLMVLFCTKDPSKRKQGKCRLLKERVCVRQRCEALSENFLVKEVVRVLEMGQIEEKKQMFLYMWDRMCIFVGIINFSFYFI